MTAAHIHKYTHMSHTHTHTHTHTYLHEHIHEQTHTYKRVLAGLAKLPSSKLGSLTSRITECQTISLSQFKCLSPYQSVSVVA